MIFIRDMELIKKISMGDSEHFIDHRAMIDDKVDPFWGRNLLSLKGITIHTDSYYKERSEIKYV
jgi:cytochrome P450 family 9